MVVAGGPNMMKMRRWRVVVFGAVAMISVLTTTFGVAQEVDHETNAKWCATAYADPDRRIGACTWLLNSGDLREEYYPTTYYNRGNAYLQGGQCDRAIRDFGEAIRLKPEARTYNNRGLGYHAKGQFDLAVRDLDEAISLRPNKASTYYFRGMVNQDRGQFDLAIRDYDDAIRLNPDYSMAYYNRGVAYSIKGQSDLAIWDYSEAIRLKPDDGEAYYNRGVEFSTKSQYARAIHDYDQAIRLKPDEARGYNSLAWLLATAPSAPIWDGERAISLARRAVSLSNLSAELDTLAAAYARAGQFFDAVATQERAIVELRSEGGTDDAIADVQSRLSLYRAGKPYQQEAK
ncbi:MAG: tetratricopeptide repeat protein [Alphaproteobacteria bacterium]|nr:tetratricopeptide repeat protein [Alphaproteobacteria bacterium]